MNHLQHGATADTLFLLGDNPPDFFALLENAFEQHKPSFDQDAALVTDSVRARWMLNRRQRARDQFEGPLYERKPDGKYFLPNPDLTEITVFDRYVITAARALSRALKDLQLIRKMAREENRWQEQLAAQKERFALDVQRFELLKEKETRRAAKPPTKAEREAALFAEVHAVLTENQDVKVDEDGPHIPQAVYVSNENGVAQVQQYVPGNDHIHRIIATADRYPAPPISVVRTYIFLGLIPAEFEWLITAGYERRIENQEIRQTFTFDEWRTIAAKEQSHEE